MAALETFIEAATKHAECTENGDYKTGNKCADKIFEAVVVLKNESKLNSLLALFDNPSVGVRLWAASYLLPLYEKESMKVLDDISLYPGIHSLIAETTLSEWKKGNLKLDNALQK